MGVGDPDESFQCVGIMFFRWLTQGGVVTLCLCVDSRKIELKFSPCKISRKLCIGRSD